MQTGRSGWRFVYQRVDRLPRLAWCARLRARSPEVEIRHGAEVEVRPGAFFEGAWNGPFADFRFDRATLSSGTGAKVVGEDVLVVAGSSRQDRVYLIDHEGDLLLSNSPVWAMVAARAEPDPANWRYLLELVMQLRTARAGRGLMEMVLRGGTLRMCAGFDLRIRPDLSIESVEKAAAPPPVSFEDYVRLLTEVTTSTIDNASHRSRLRRYVPLVTVSRGYDSTAVAAVAVRAGCREAITFAEHAPGVPAPDDGTPVADALGMSVLRRARDAWRLRTDMPEAEAWACPPGHSVTLASIEDDLAGRLLITGHFGDRVFELKTTTDPAGLSWGVGLLTAASQIELRLRVGFVNLAPLFISWQHLDVIRRMADTPEIAPFHVGGDYDRPVARRIVEEAGVPRALFGQIKLMGGIAILLRPRDLTPTSQADFRAFVAEGPSALRQTLRSRSRDLAWDTALGVESLRRRVAVRLGATVAPPRQHWRRVQDGRLFHWGFARTRNRYAV